MNSEYSGRWRVNSLQWEERKVWIVVSCGPEIWWIIRVNITGLESSKWWARIVRGKLGGGEAGCGITHKSEIWRVTGLECCVMAGERPGMWQTGNVPHDRARIWQWQAWNVACYRPGMWHVTDPECGMLHIWNVVHMLQTQNVVCYRPGM